MKREDIERLVEIRGYLIECHNSLDGATAAASAVVKQVDVAHDFSRVIQMIDGVLSPYVNFE